MVTVHNVNPKGFYKQKNDTSNWAYQVMELWPGVMTLKVSVTGCMNIRYCDAEEVTDLEGKRVVEWKYAVEDRRGLLKWFYHENSDTFFIQQKGANFGNEESFIHLLGDCNEGTELELMEILCSHSHWENQDITKFTIDYTKPE